MNSDYSDGLLGAILLATLTFGAPACLGDPYAQLDPRLVALWLSYVAESRNLFSMMRDLPQQLPAYFGLPLAGLVLGAIQCLRGPGEKRWNWIVCIATQAALSLIAVWEVRGAAGANALGAALVPAALLRMLPAPNGHATYFGMGRAALISALLLNPVALIALGSGAARAVEAATGMSPPLILSGGPGTCQRASDYAPLASLPRGRVVAFIDAGPFILLETDHAVLAAPYHRNETGNVAMLDIFLGAPNGAEARLAARGIDYVAFCPGAPDRYDYVASAPNSLVAALSRSDVPSFLERIPLDSTDLAVYRVRR